MTRRSRKRRRSSTRSAELIQIVGLTLVLVMVLLFRDEIAGGAGALFDSMGPEDVTLPEEQPDAGVTR